MHIYIKYSLLWTGILLWMPVCIAIAGPQGTTIRGKTSAVTEVTQVNTYQWNLTETTQIPNQVPFVIPQGQSSAIGFTIIATRLGPVVTQTQTPITGEVCISNTGFRWTQGLSLIDQLEQEVSPGVWNPVSGPITIPITREIPPQTTRCYEYRFEDQIDPTKNYRNHAIVSIDNQIGFEGVTHSIDLIAPLKVTLNQQNIDSTATVTDPVTCPSGFVCAASGSTILVTGTTVIPLTVVATNQTAKCGQSLVLSDLAILIPSTHPTEITAEASVTIYTGTCHL